MFYGDVEIAFANLRRMRTGGLQQVGHDVVDARDFLADIFDDLTSRTRCWQVAADDFDYSCNASERIADFMCQPCSHFTKSREVFGTRHLSAVKALDFLAALAKLNDHLVEVTAEVSDFIVAVGEADGYGEVTSAEFGDLLLQ